MVSSAGYIFGGSLIILLGVLQILVAVFQWKWFINLVKVKLTYQTLGKTGATVFYIVLGLSAVVTGILTLLKGV